jgi:acyl carrier protein
MTEVEERIGAVLVERFGVEASAVAPEAAFADLGLDSLHLVELALAVEEELGVRLTAEDADALVTVGGLAAHLRTRGAPAG